MVKSYRFDDNGLKRGPWSPEEDQKLLTYIQQHGHGSWRSLPQKAGLQRCGKSCRLRWINYLRPDVKRGKFTLHEEQTIIQLHALLGNRWSTIAAYLPKRTDNEIKNHWNTHLKKRLAMMGIDPMTHKPKIAALPSADRDTKNASNLSHMAQWESARLEAEARQVRESKLHQNEPAPAAPAAGGSSRLNKQSAASRIAQPRCLDILKAWQNVCQATTGGGDSCGGGGDKRNGSGIGLNVVGCDLESPTSVLKLSEIENFCEYDGRKNIIVGEVFSAGNSSRSNHQQQIGYGESWTMGSGVASNTVPAGGQNNFIEDIIFHNATATAAASADDDGGRHDEQAEVTLSTVHIDDDFCEANGFIDGAILHEVAWPLGTIYSTWWTVLELHQICRFSDQIYIVE